MEYLTKSEAETEALGARLAEQLEPGGVVAFTGDLGAGKTAFTRGGPGAGDHGAGDQPHLHRGQRV